MRVPPRGNVAPTLACQRKKEIRGKGGEMPTNLVVINGSAGLTWEVEDSKIDELMEFLHKVGVQQQPSLPGQREEVK